MTSSALCYSSTCCADSFLCTISHTAQTEMCADLKSERRGTENISQCSKSERSYVYRELVLRIYSWVCVPRTYMYMNGLIINFKIRNTPCHYYNVDFRFSLQQICASGHRSLEGKSTEELYAASRQQGFLDTVKGRILAGNYFLLEK